VVAVLVIVVLVIVISVWCSGRRGPRVPGLDQAVRFRLTSRWVTSLTRPMPAPMTHLLPTRTVRALVVVGLLLVAAAGTIRSTPVFAAPQVVTELTSIDTAADATVAADGRRLVAPDNFPMATAPRCDILNNFGDPRSGGRHHEGIDILATLGQEVYAMADGTLTLQVVAGSTANGASLSGNLWKLTAATGGTYYIYAHLSGFAPNLVKGSVVTKGQLLGWVGDTGNAGPGNYHLHFEIHPGGGAAVDALPLVKVPLACKVWG